MLRQLAAVDSVAAHRLVLMILMAACSDNEHVGPLVYTAPSGGKLLLVRDEASTGTKLVLDFIVGDQPLSGYSTGFDVPTDATKVTLVGFTAGTSLDPGPAPVAGGAAIARSGPLAGQLVTALSQKATATPTDATLPAGATLFSLELDAVEPLAGGVVFDGGATSAGLRDRGGTTVVDTPDVAIGKLEVVP